MRITNDAAIQSRHKHPETLYIAPFRTVLDMRRLSRGEKATADASIAYGEAKKIAAMGKAAALAAVVAARIKAPSEKVKFSAALDRTKSTKVRLQDVVSNGTTFHKVFYGSTGPGTSSYVGMRLGTVSRVHHESAGPVYTIRYEADDFIERMNHEELLAAIDKCLTDHQRGHLGSVDSAIALPLLITERRKMNAEHKSRMSKPGTIARSAIIN